MRKKRDNGTNEKERNIRKRDFLPFVSFISVRSVISFLALLLAPLIYFLPAVAGRVALVPGDGWTHNLGVRVLAGQILASGALPLWNPHVFSGMPLLASVDPGALYPLNWIFTLLPPAAAMNALVIASYHLALAGAYLFARRTQCTRTASFAAAMIFAFGGFLITHLAHTHRLTAIVWLPWLLLAVEAMAQSRMQRLQWLWGAAGAVFIALQVFAGDPQTTLYGYCVVALYTFWRLTQIEDWIVRRRLIVGVMLMFASGALLSMMQLLPQAELLDQGGRARIGYEEFSSYSLPPRQALALIMPYFFGGAALTPYSAPYSGAWNSMIQGGYTGLLGLTLAFAALILRFRNPAVWLWTIAAVAALLLSFGAHLPADLYRLFYGIPVYNLFRGSYRHLYEFDFAVAMLAAIGIDALRKSERAKAAAIAATGVTAVLLCAAVWMYSGAGRSLGDAEAAIPVAVFVTGAVAMLFFVLKRNNAAAVILLVILALDLASFGWFYDWRAVENRIAGRLSDPPTLAFIKSRTGSPHDFRVLSVSDLPYDYTYDAPFEKNYDAMNLPDASSARGLHSVNGMDVLGLTRVMDFSGLMDASGIVRDPASLGAEDRSFDLLNVRYLLVERRGSLDPKRSILHDGIAFSNTTFGREFKPGVKLRTDGVTALASEIALVTSMFNSVHLADGETVLRIKLHTSDGRVFEREVQAGRDTSEWAHDQQELRDTVKHRRAQVAESRPGDGFEIHSYLARLTFDRSLITHIEWEYAREDAGIYLVRASLFDAPSRVSTPIVGMELPAERWRKLAQFDDISIYENLRALPRAWFAEKVKIAPEQEILDLIRRGISDPERTAYVDREWLERAGITDAPVSSPSSDGSVRIVNYAPNRIEMETRRAQPGFLVLSEVHFPGWEARINGVAAQVYRTNYVLRGVMAPKGTNRVEFVYRPASFRRGAWCAVGGVLLLVVWGAASSGMIRKRKGDRG
ncbi:MAG: YfhO family protein [Blastocatellales bacterium]|nr:YfhO family protein [Blastocatellales bacterium]